MNKARTYQSPLTAKILNRISSEQKESIDKKMELAVILDDVLKAKELSIKDFAGKMGKRPTEIKRWLSGTYNFTIDTLLLIENVLEVHLVTIPNKISNKRRKKNNSLFPKSRLHVN